jgi:hypothetical protein
MRFARPSGTPVLTAAVALAILAAPAFLGAKHQESEQELLDRIEHETNIAKKARLQAELATLKLDEAATAFDHDQYESGRKLLDQYTGWIHKAWNVLEESGRDASRKAQGFKDLDISLRENARSLADLAERTPFADRGPIEETAKTADDVHSQVIAALFPGGVVEQDAAPTKAPPAEPSPGPAEKPVPESKLRAGGP